MASQTTYYNLIKPATSDPADIADINSNSDTIDSALNSLNTQSGNLKFDIAYVEDTNTATHAIDSLSYVVWKGSLYRATANIAVGATLSSSNLTAISNGGLNAVRNSVISTSLTASQYATMNSGYTGASVYVTRYTPSLAKIHIDLNKSGMAKGEVTIGTTTTRVKGTGYLAGRATTANGTLPATAVVTGNGGAIRLYLPDVSSACVVNGFIAIEETV